MSSPLQFSEYHNLAKADPDYLKRKLTAFSYQLLLQRALSWQGPGLRKLILVSQKKPSNLIQKLFMTETVSTVIAKSYYYIAGSSLLLLSKSELSVTVVECFLWQITVTKSSLLDAGGDPGVKL